MPSIGGCGGKLADAGWAMVIQLAPNGTMLLQYQDGKMEWKVIQRDNLKAHFEIAAKNILKPARFVETKQGSTLTFPDGDTILYRNVDKTSP
jgi:hypothetical protein